MKKIILSGGGTGGHIFPALAIGRELKAQFPDMEILYVGASGGMEMEIVPKNNFPIKGLWISGIQRQFSLKNLLKNLLFPLKFLVSLYQAHKILSDFRPDAVIGVGGYASGSLGLQASRKGIPLFICEQNALPGLTNRKLAPKAAKILLGNEDALKYFDKEKCVITGNPIRKMTLADRKLAKLKFGLDPDKLTVLSLGGSLGAMKLNEAWEAQLPLLVAEDIQLVWQCGKRYYEEIKNRIVKHENIRIMPFIEEVETAYSAADLVVSRAGGSTISELIALRKPAILIPSPNVADDHQTKNALSLVNQGAAVLVKDIEARDKLIPTIITLLTTPDKLHTLQKNIENIKNHDATKEIVAEITEYLKTNHRI
jgi:UDP-N-acetylglucosamine--N-acetylmuramyl-(pentapeptide) pyrophosphoryl-undecaprenol N-acetylglucosamine transferase